MDQYPDPSQSHRELRPMNGAEEWYHKIQEQFFSPKKREKRA